MALIFLFGIASGNIYARGVVPIDSRITVIVLEDNMGQIIRNETVTTILNAKLLEMGFKHVVDASHTINLNDAKLLDHIYRDDPEEFEMDTDNVVDYLVLVKSSKGENFIEIPNYGSGGSVESPLKSIKNILRVNVIVYDTGEIIGAFNSEGIGFANNLSRASDKATEIASNDAADKLADIFKNLSAQTMYQLSFKIFADDEKNLEQILADLNSVSAVKNIHVYEQYGRSAVLSIDSYQPPREIVKQLKDITFLNVSVDKISGNSCELRISNEEEFADEKIFDDDYDFDESKFYPNRKHSISAGGVIER